MRAGISDSPNTFVAFTIAGSDVSDAVLVTGQFQVHFPRLIVVRVCLEGGEGQDIDIIRVNYGRECFKGEGRW